MEKKKNEKLNFYLDNYPLKKLFFMDLSKDLWEKFNPTESLFSKINYELMYRLSEELKEFFRLTENDEIAVNEIKKVKWLIISVWDFFKKSPPKFDALLFTMNNDQKDIIFINPFEEVKEEFIYKFKDPSIWKEKNLPGTKFENIYSDYSKWIFDVFNKNRKRKVHFWDFLHSFKRFIWPYVITKESYSAPLKELNKDLVKIILNEKIAYDQDINNKINNDCLWYWELFKEIVDEGDNPKDVFEEILRGYYNKLGEGVGAKYIYEFPIILNTEKFKKKFFFQSVATVSFGSVEPINYPFWEYLIYCYIKSYLQIFLPSSFIARFKVNSLKSAIAAIMSRNSSHNIGSHVLVSLSLESISAADDRVLFKYLQQRMDYIAQVSTEMPTWSSPIWFISDLMKRFYMQTHLLEYIGKSEGLGSLNWSREDETGKIVIKIKDAKKGKYIINYWEKDELIPILDDFQLAIPGGIVGLHAFYNILENIIRNSAKHNWEKYSLKNAKNLEITIEFENNPDEEFVVFKIYDNVSDDNGNGKCEDEKNNGECKKEKKRLHEKMNDIFSTDFIEESGKLKKENWGLAEMRISAGYLNQKSYQEIGFHKVEDKLAIIIEAAPQMDNSIERLAYKFNVPKPKDLLIIGDPTLTDLKKEDVKILKTSGIYIENRIEDKSYEHEIVVIFEKALNGNYKTLERMPGRVIIVKDNKESNDLIAAISKDLEIEEKIVERKIVILDQLKKDIKNSLTSNTNDGREKREDFKIGLYQTWVSNLINSKEFFYLDLKGRSDFVISDYLEEQMYQLIKKHVDKSKFLESECHINEERVLENLRNEFRRMTTDELKILLSKHRLSAEIMERLNNDGILIERIGKKLENKKNILKDFIFRDEDKIATVPGTLIPKYKKENISSWIDDFNALFPYSDPRSKIKYTADDEKATICYKRHLSINEYTFPKKDDGAGKLPDDIKSGYRESLSGSQFYFTMLYDSLTSQDEGILIKNRKKKIILQLIENALLKCVIIDERAARFLSSSGVLQKKFELLGIWIPFRIHFNGKKEIPLTENHYNNAKTFSDENLAGYDIFIIHQGVLDKMGLNDKQKAGEFLEGIKKSVPFVFITSGRGKPDNVADNVKFLPFSSIDSFLLKEYPEKLLLIQSAMRLNLPKKGESA